MDKILTHKTPTCVNTPTVGGETLLAKITNTAEKSMMYQSAEPFYLGPHDACALCKHYILEK